MLLPVISGIPVPDPLPQIVVRSQSGLYPDQPGQQVDLTNVLPTGEVFWLNLEEGYFACQILPSSKFLKLFKLSRLCDGTNDCYKGSDELVEEMKCSKECVPGKKLSKNH